MTLYRGGWPYANPPNTQFTLNTQSPQARGLVGWWPTLEQAGQRVIKNRGVAGGDFSYYDGGATTVEHDPQRGDVLYFDATANPQYRISDNPTLSLGAAPWTISVWLRSDDDTQSNETLAKFSYGSSGWAIAYWAGQFNLLHWAGPGDFYVGPNPAVEGKWYHLVWVNTSANHKIYLDGKLDSNQTSGATVDNAVALDINHQNTFKGAISDFRIYSKRAFSPAEVLHLYQNPWDLYQPVIPWALPLITAPVVGQPTQIRTQGIPTGSGYLDRPGKWN